MSSHKDAIIVETDFFFFFQFARQPCVSHFHPRFKQSHSCLSADFVSDWIQLTLFMKSALNDGCGPEELLPPLPGRTLQHVLNMRKSGFQLTLIIRQRTNKVGPLTQGAKVYHEGSLKHV